MERRCCALPDVPRWGLRDAIPRDAIRSGGTEILADMGKIKQNVPDMKWWVTGVHQILLWVGTARQGKRANANAWRNLPKWR